MKRAHKYIFSILSMFLCDGPFDCFARVVPEDDVSDESTQIDTLVNPEVKILDRLGVQCTETSYGQNTHEEFCNQHSDSIVRKVTRVCVGKIAAVCETFVTDERTKESCKLWLNSNVCPQPKDLDLGLERILFIKDRYRVECVKKSKENECRRDLMFVIRNSCSATIKSVCESAPSRHLQITCKKRLSKLICYH